MKKVLLLSLLTVTLFSYEKGDSLDTHIQKELGATGDKVYIIDFFASWCGSCKKELPLIAKLNRAIDKKKVEIIGVDVDKDPKKAAAFQKKLRAENNLNFNVINDANNHIINAFHPIGMPALYYVKNGRVLKVTYGAVANIDKKIMKELETL